MPYFKTSQEWLDLSTALIEARPSTTRVTTRYTIKPVKSSRKKPASDSANEPPAASAPASASEPKPPRASLVLKTFDPVSGVTLKYRTTKAAEVTRLMHAAMGRLGRALAGMPDVPEETMQDADAAAGAAETQSEQQQQQQPPPPPPQQQQQAASGGGSGGGKKKKKGKK